MQNIEHSSEILHELRNAGAKIAMDDFGTGYSSLSYLARLPIDALKIDRSFVRTITDGHDDLEIASAIISMAKALGLKTIAEGVETRGQYQLLRELGCNQVQGFLISPAVPEDAALKLLLKGSAAQEVEVAAAIGLQDVLVIEPRIAPRRQRRQFESLAPSGHLRVAHQ